MGKNILEKMLVEYGQYIEEILKNCGEKDRFGEIIGVFRFISYTEMLGSGLKQ